VFGWTTSDGWWVESGKRVGGDGRFGRLANVQNGGVLLEGWTDVVDAVPKRCQTLVPYVGWLRVQTLEGGPH
jgi:hypothetical protein